MRPLARGVVVALLGALCVLEGLTILAALILLDPSYVPLLLWPFWGARTVGYGLAAVWMWQEQRRGTMLALCMFGLVLLLSLSAVTDLTLEQGYRRQASILGTLLVLMLQATGSSLPSSSTASGTPLRSQINPTASSSRSMP